MSATSPRGSLARSFLEALGAAWPRVEVTVGGGARLTLDEGLGRTVELMERRCARGGKLVFIGNGGSAAIASHQAVDYWKNGGLRALAFNDASLLTCISNDYGYERVFAEPIARLADAGDVVVAISSSGRSPNIVNGAEAAQKAGCDVITLSGFAKDNPLRAMGHFNFYMPSHSYGIVEIVHLSLLHAMLEDSMTTRTGGGAASRG